MTNFVGHDWALEGFIMLDVRVGRHESQAGFFMMDVKTNYDVLLSRDWIHSNICVPSSLHQILFIWRLEGDVEVIYGDPNPFGEEAFHAEAMIYLPHFTSFKIGDKTIIEMDRPAVAATGKMADQS